MLLITCLAAEHADTPCQIRHLYWYAVSPVHLINVNDVVRRFGSFISIRFQDITAEVRVIHVCNLLSALK